MNLWKLSCGDAHSLDLEEEHGLQQADDKDGNDQPCNPMELETLENE